MLRRIPSRRRANSGRLSNEAVAAARREAEEQIVRRGMGVVQMQQLRELESVIEMLENLDHPVWWAISFALIPFVTIDESGSVHDAVAQISREQAEHVRTAFQSARVPFLVPIIERLSGKQAAKADETEERALIRILIERGASSYEAVRVAGAHSEDVQSAGLPQAEVRAARRLAAKLRAEAVKKHAVLVKQVIPHKPVLVGPILNHVKDGLLALIDSSKQAEIVRNIDKNNPRRKRSRPG